MNVRLNPPNIAIKSFVRHLYVKIRIAAIENDAYRDTYRDADRDMDTELLLAAREEPDRAELSLL